MPRPSFRARLRAIGARLADERGVAAVEAALTFPFLVAVSAGLFEFGSLFYNFQLMQTGVRDAGRYLSRIPDLAAAEESAKRLAVTGSILSGQKARVSWWKTEHIQISYRTTANPRDATTGLRNYRARYRHDHPHQHDGTLSGRRPSLRDRPRHDPDQRLA